VPVQKIENGLVVLLDALGVSRFSIDECADFVRKRNEIVAAASQSYLLDENRELLKDNLKATTSAQFGDTLLYAWTFDEKSDVAKSVLFDFLMMWLANLLWNGIEQQVFYRGAISFGPILIADTHTVIGPAVADAAAWYEQADWFGVFATPSCGIAIDYLKLIRKEINPDNYGKELSDISIDTCGISAVAETYSPALMRYEVPLHGGDKEMLAVSWPYAGVRKEKNKANAKKALFAALSSLPKPLAKGVEGKYEKSIKFFDHCIAQK
jgi:hypothetical protein